MFRARVQTRWALIAQASSRGFILRTLGDNPNRKAQELSRWRRSEPRANEQALMLSVPASWKHRKTRRRRWRRRRLLWSRCDAGAIPCPGKWETDPQAQIRLGAHPRPGEESCCYLIAHGEVAQVRSLGNEARSTRAVSRRAEEVRDQQRTLSPGRQATKN